MPGTKDEITIWRNGTKKREKKNYLAMFLREACKITSIRQGEIFQILWPCPKNMLLLKLPPEDQCKFIIPENFINKLKAMSILHDYSSIWDNVLCNSTTQVHNVGKGTVRIVLMAKRW